MPAMPAKSSAGVPLQAASTPTVDAALAAGAAIIHPVSYHCGGAHPATQAGAAAPGIVIREMRPFGEPMPSLQIRGDMGCMLESLVLLPL